ncbi:hypothetical protein [Listeria ivanovii]|nr:hypothetical protein [Listeria ivanovii]
MNLEIKKGTNIYQLIVVGIAFLDRGKHPIDFQRGVSFSLLDDSD